MSYQLYLDLDEENATVFIPNLSLLMSLGMFTYHMKMLRTSIPCTPRRSNFRALLCFFFSLVHRLSPVPVLQTEGEKNIFKDTVLYIILRNKLQNLSAKHGSVSLEVLKMREHKLERKQLCAVLIQRRQEQLVGMLFMCLL